MKKKVYLKEKEKEHAHVKQKSPKLKKGYKKFKVDSKAEYDDQIKGSDEFLQAKRLMKKLKETDEMQIDEKEVEEESRRNSLSIRKEEKIQLPSIIKKPDETTQTRTSIEKKIVHFADEQPKLTVEDDQSIYRKRLIKGNEEQMKKSLTTAIEKTCRHY